MVNGRGLHSIGNNYDQIFFWALELWYRRGVGCARPECANGTFLVRHSVRETGYGGEDQNVRDMVTQM